VGQIRGRWGTFDRACVIAALAKSREQDHLVALDNMVELKTWPYEMRIASRRTGEALLGVHKRLGTAGASDYHFRVKSQQAFGHAPVMQGFLWAKADLDVQTAVAMSAHMLCVSLIGAAIRLGIVTHIEAQFLFGDAHKEIDSICAKPAPDPKCASAFTPQSEIAVMKHEYQEARLFAN
jgi:urease accessory protein